ncbi:natural cytotoxicity triggering receptor 2-like [Octodon degus]|uniref:Natural cytotoxicity triggering receptor 2-like n=1 Tax=Octodon degus TaxID=10160 RepID=A0A6P6F052_OCTDE|nr:natural cytotoxicity triggering receptor 2-like [Octodon degus]
MAWRVGLPPRLLLLLLLLPGSRVCSDIQVLQRVAGETLSVTCNYPSRGESYVKKSLCRQVTEFICGKMVPGASASAQGQVPRLSIRDYPAAGHYVVSLAGLKEEDSGHYWCSMHHASSHMVFNSIKFYLAVSPAPTPAPRTTCNPTSSKGQSSVSPTEEITKAPEAPSAFTTPARPWNATLCPGPEVPCALDAGVCGLFLTKSLVLLALLWTWWSRRVQLRGSSATGPQCCPEPQCPPSLGPQECP